VLVTMVYRHFGPKALRTFQTSDLGHFSLSFGHFGIILVGLIALWLLHNSCATGTFYYDVF